MGIDAEMFVRAKRTVTDDEVRRYRVQLVKAFGTGPFSIWRERAGEAPLDAPTEWESDRNQHALERAATYYQDGEEIEPEPGETFLRVNLIGRYYGIGYERGNLPQILGIARFLRDVVGGEVWYGGDSSGVCARPLDDAYAKELWDHFCEVQHDPYVGAFDSVRKSGIQPSCAFCGQLPMVQYMFGGDMLRGAWSCHGCGYRTKTADGGLTWADVKSEEE